MYVCFEKCQIRTQDVNKQITIYSFKPNELFRLSNNGSRISVNLIQPRKNRRLSFHGIDALATFIPPWYTFKTRSTSYMVNTSPGVEADSPSDNISCVDNKIHCFGCTMACD